MQNTPQNSLTQFKLFQKFHLFYYSRKDDQTFFLLRQKKSGSFSEIKGHLQLHDPGILFSAGRKIIQLSSGLLTPQNLEFFAENSQHDIVTRDMLQFCKQKQSMPALLNTKLFQKFIEDSFESMKPYQEEGNDDAYFFIEIPYLDLEKLNTFCETNSLKLNLRYATQAEIISQESSTIISDSLKQLFTPSLTSYVDKFIQRAEPIPITARYAVVCILTTPTNYRTMGLLGSYYKKHGEEWKFYRFPLEEPSESELSQLDGLLIPGATVCAADKSLVWRDKLLKIIRLVYEDYPACKILGTCFGIQIISEALGGKCERMPEPIRGASQLQVQKSFWDLPYINDLDLKPQENLLISKSHFDAVVEPPKMATIYASSKTCPIEIMGIEDRLLAFQGHPEINESWTACLIYQAANEKVNFNGFYEKIKEKHFQEELRHEMWLKIVFSFFKKRLVKREEEPLQQAESYIR